MNYYNEFDPKAAAWLRELIRAGQIPNGTVDERSISDVTPDDLVGFTQCHFFAGIAGWPLALKLAGVPDDFPLWTGSCPCQPFSVAGAGLGTADPRHLWPQFRRLIGECNPSTVFGEQVASKAGRVWLAGVRADLENMGYGVGAADLCAASVGAPHIRQRLFWGASRVADAKHPERWSEHQEHSEAHGWDGPRRGSNSLRLAHTPGRGLGINGSTPGGAGHADECGEVGGVVHSQRPGLEGHPGHGDDRNEPGRHGAQPGRSTAEAGAVGHWARAALIPCRDGKSRRVEPGTFPLAHGVPHRVVKLRGYGNAIVPQVAAEFVRACMS